MPPMPVTPTKTLELTAWSRLVAGLTETQASAVAASGLVTVLYHALPEHYELASDSHVGVVRLEDGFELRVTPKLAIPRLMFLLSYARDPRGWRESGPHYEAEDDLLSAVASAFATHAERALAPVPIHGYVAVEERSTTLRGRLCIADQIARWPAQPLPLEIVHDDFTIDVAENRLLRGAAELLLRLPLLPLGVRRRLLRIRATLEEVLPEPPAADVQAPMLTRLNERYGPALTLAELILRQMSISTRRGEVIGVAFVFDMNAVFEDFLSAALKTALELHGGRVEAQYRRLHLDLSKRIRLIPDLTWWRDRSCRAVIDAKYKPLTDQRFPNADAYQMLAYCTALGLERGYLVYAKDAGEPDRNHVIENADKLIHVRAIDVEKPPPALLAQVHALADEIARPSPYAASTAA
jgi:5-methylcytosine-specific restriction enzyme subunit McrC